MMHANLEMAQSTNESAKPPFARTTIFDQEAEAHFKEGLAECEKTLGHDHIDTLKIAKQPHHGIPAPRAWRRSSHNQLPHPRLV